MTRVPGSIVREGGREGALSQSASKQHTLSTKRPTIFFCSHDGPKLLRSRVYCYRCYSYCEHCCRRVLALLRPPQSALNSQRGRAIHTHTTPSHPSSPHPEEKGGGGGGGDSSNVRQKLFCHTPAHLVGSTSGGGDSRKGLTSPTSM